MADSKVNLLDAEAIAQGEALGVWASGVVEGFLAGEHRSPFRGFAVEFVQHREYSPGDDLRHLDWKVLARSERYYLKQYEQETNFVCHILVDGSESMSFAGARRESKLRFASRLAACLAYLVLWQRDAVSLALFDSDVREYVPRTSALASVHEMMRLLAAYQAAEGVKTDLGGVLHRMAASTPRRGIVVVISDLLDEEESVLKGIQHLKFGSGGSGGHEVIVFHTLDPAELEFRFDGNVEFEGYEGGGKLQTRPGEIRASYLKEFGAFRERVRLGCEQNNCRYVLADTSRPVAEVLGEYLARQGSLSRR